MRRYLFACVLALGATAATAQLPTTIEVPPGQLAPADVDFLRTADTANMDQLTFAMRMTGRDRTVTRSLAENVLKTHRDADNALKMLAPRKHVELDHAMSDRARIEADDLLRQDIDADKLYVEHLVRDGRDMIALYETTLRGSPDPDIRQYADTFLDKLRANHRQAEDLLRAKGWAPDPDR
jgi:predicted outer membrane protein